MSAKTDIQRKTREQATVEANYMRGEFTPALQKAMNLARERGSSSWLTALPLTTEELSGCTTNTTNGARLDIAVNGFWGGGFEQTFLDVRVFNPYAPSNRNTTIEKCFRKHELEKKRAYSQRVREIEHASFTPLVLSASGGLTKKATNFNKRLASLLADKWDQPYSQTMNWL